MKKQLEEIEEQIKLYRTQYHASKSVSLLLISTDKETIAKNTITEKNFQQEIQQRYGNLPFDWIMYKENQDSYSFTQLIVEFQKQSKINLDIYVLDISDYKHLSCLEDLKHKFITVIDCLALDIVPAHEKICGRLDARKIGGCLLPICQNLSSELQKRMREAKNKTLQVLCGETNNNFTVSLGHIELELPTKYDFQRRLSNIIFGFSLITEKVHIQFEDEASKVIQNSKLDLRL